MPSFYPDDIKMQDKTPESPEPTRLLQGAWRVRRGCLAAAWGGASGALAPRSESWIARWRHLFSPRERWFMSHGGEGLASAGGLGLSPFTVTSGPGLCLRLDRLVAFEEALALRTRFVRRIPLSGAGAWQVAQLTGDGQAMAATFGRPWRLSLDETEMPEASFDPESVVAWSAGLTLGFITPKLTWRLICSPVGYREVRVRFQGSGEIWIDGGATAATLAHKPRGRRPAPPVNR